MTDIKVVVTTTKHHTCVIRTEELIKLLNGAAGAIYHRPVPADAEITITVPSGGDYSGDNLELDECGGLQVSWVETEQS